ncbi:hypothetical protein SD81_017240 [Tolypothrix campylonemoides VB511288]|nr:hypothetical protein SD81_017240 [Tolypothrix campylonemoides VB511288]
MDISKYPESGYWICPDNRTRETDISSNRKIFEISYMAITWNRIVINTSSYFRVSGQFQEPKSETIVFATALTSSSSAMAKIGLITA